MVSVIIFLITAIWLVIFIVDNALEYKIGFRYISWKFHHDILLKPFYLRWHSPKLGIRTFHDFNFNLLNKKYIHWFNTGVFTTILICLYGYSLFFPPIFQFLKTNYLDEAAGASSSQDSLDSDADQSSINGKNLVHHSTGLVVGIPGWNLPASHAILVFFALLISGMIHEFGHALASAREHVSIHGAASSWPKRFLKQYFGHNKGENTTFRLKKSFSSKSRVRINVTFEHISDQLPMSLPHLHLSRCIRLNQHDRAR